MRGYLRLWLAETLATWAARLSWSAAVDALVDEARGRDDLRAELQVYQVLCAPRHTTLAEMFGTPVD